MVGLLSPASDLVGHTRPTRPTRPTDGLAFSRLDLLLLLMVGIWGANFSAIKYALRDFPEVSFNAMRLVLAGAVFLVAMLRHQRQSAAGERPPQPRLTRREWATLVMLALVGTVLYQLFFLAGLARTSVANSALMFGCTPVAVAIMSSVAGHERLTAARWGGAALSLAGIYALVGHRAELSAATFVGDLLVFCGMLCWSLYSVAAQPMLKRHSPLVVTGWAMMIGAAPLRHRWRSLRSSPPTGLVSRHSVGC